MAPTPHRPQRCWRREAWDSALPTSVHARPPHPCPPTFLTPVCPPSSLVCPPRPRSTLLARLQASIHVHPPHPHLPTSPLSARLTCLPTSVHVHPPHPVCRLSPCPPSSPVCSSHPSARLTPVCLPQPCLLSSPVCPPTHSPPSSAWSKCLTRLRRPTFPWGLGLQEVPTLVQRPRAGGPAQSGSVRCSRSPQDTASRTHMAAQAGGRPCMRVGKGEGAVASAGSSGKGSPSRTQKAPDTNRA